MPLPTPLNPLTKKKIARTILKQQQLAFPFAFTLSKYLLGNNYSLTNKELQF